MDLLDLAILALRIALVAVLYAFLWFVLRGAQRSLQGRRPVASPSLELRLVVLDAGGSDLLPGQVIELSAGAILGRAERAELVVADASVSAEHARISRVGRNWVVRDLDSTNGTLVNEAPVNGQTRLQDGDIVGLGGVRFRVDLPRSGG